MSQNIFSPLEVRALHVVASEFGLDQDPVEGMTIKMEFSLTEEPEQVAVIDEASELHTQSLQLVVETRLVSGDEQEEQHMHASVTVNIETACRASKSASGVTEYMRTNGVSIAYGHARSCISNMTSMSPMGQFLIPAIDPRALLEELRNDER